MFLQQINYLQPEDGFVKNKHGIGWILAGIVASLLMTQFSAMAAEKVVVVPLFSSGSGDIIQTVKSKTGRVWMDRNLGAIRVAGSKSDSLAYGWLYQWGRSADGHESRTSPVTAVNDLSNGEVPGHGNFILVNVPPLDWLSLRINDLWDGVRGVNNPCPPGFRIPSHTEWVEEIKSWIRRTNQGAFESPLKLTCAGRRSYSTGEIQDAGLFGYYHSTAQYGRVVAVYIEEDQVITHFRPKASGLSVRCIQD